MKKRVINVLCIIDKSFENNFEHPEKLIDKTIQYINKKLPKEFLIKYTLKRGETLSLKPAWKFYLKNLSKYKSEIIMEFIDKGLYKVKEPYAAGVAWENKIIVQSAFPIKNKKMYFYALKKITLHEFGHMFGLGDSLFKNPSIMDTGFFFFTSRFSKKDRTQMKKYLNPKLKLKSIQKGDKLRDHFNIKENKLKP